MTLRASIALAAALVTASCGAPLMKLPSGPGSPAADGADALSQSLATCARINTFSAEIAVSGRVGGRRTRVRLLAGLARPASAYLEAPAPFGAPGFVFAAHDEDATLLLPRDRRVLQHGAPAAVLEAIAGIPLSPSDLREALTGCASSVDATAARRLGDDWLVISGASDLYLHQERRAEPWRLVAVVHREPGGLEWRAEYRGFLSDLPRAIRLTSADGTHFDLQLALSQVEINGPLEAGTFRVQIPDAVTPITLEELRQAGPLAEPSAR